MVIPRKGNDVGNDTCTVDGCDKPRRSAGADYCKMYYHRWYRHGSVDKVSRGSGVTVSLGRRYKRMRAVGHPVADANGMAYVHRVVLFDEIGPGPHVCHWCDVEVDWLPRGMPGELQVDHLNNDGADNRAENLVPACRDCNAGRGAQRRMDALRDAGFWSNNDTIAALRSRGRTIRVEDRKSA